MMQANGWLYDMQDIRGKLNTVKMPIISQRNYSYQTSCLKQTLSFNTRNLTEIKKDIAGGTKK